MPCVKIGRREQGERKDLVDKWSEAKRIWKEQGKARW
jgi:hypothetical protein